MAGITSGWISWLCSQKGHEILAPVELDFIRDIFNLTGLKTEFKDYNAAMKIILSDAVPPEDLSTLPYNTRAVLTEAIELYGLIHARYVLTQAGLAIMAMKFKDGAFGVCPRIMCQKQNVLPIGVSDELRQYSCRVYCPMCQEVYLSRAEIHRKSRPSVAATARIYTVEMDSSADDDGDHSSTYSSTDPWENLEESHPSIPIDGAFFGTTLPHMLLMTYPRLVSTTIPIPHIPQLFGFKQYGVKSVILMKIDNGEFGEHARLQMGTVSDSKYVERDLGFLTESS